MQKVNKLASYATYRQLYNDGKSDTYIVIAKFVEHIIISNQISCFEVGEISRLLNENFSFSIPSYVLQTAIAKIDFITKKEGKYIVDLKRISKQDSEITKDLENANLSSQALTNKLLQYVKDDNQAYSVDQDKLIRDFSSFLLDESSNGEYSRIISKFVVENESDEVFLKNINQIKEGAILFSGLNYTSDISNTAWHNDINLYVGTEILFHLAGYNGTLFQDLASEMFNLIKEMNQKNKKRRITIRYFKEVQEEIEKFFGTAEEIVKGNKFADLGNVAMDTIVDGCSSAADVLSKRAEFNNLLQHHSIAIAKSEDYYSEKYHSFNIESQDIINKYDLSTENKENYLKYLNYTNILRGRDSVSSSNSNLRDSKHIIVTEVGKILQISKEFILNNDNELGIPLAINMNTLTKRLWFDLNKGFGSKQLPSTFNVLDKSRLILSNLLTQKVSQQYDRIVKSYRNGELSEDDLNENILLLRQEIKKPEEIHKELLNDIDTVTTATSLEIYKSQKDTLIKEVKELKEERKREELEKEREVEARKTAEREIERISKETTKEKLKRLDDVRVRKKNADDKIKFKLNCIRIGMILILVFLLIIMLYVYGKCPNEVNIIIGMTPLVLVVLFLILGKKFEAWDIVRKVSKCIERWYKKKLYAEYNIDINNLKELEDELETLPQKNIE